MGSAQIITLTCELTFNECVSSRAGGVTRLAGENMGGRGRAVSLGRPALLHTQMGRKQRRENKSHASSNGVFTCREVTLLMSALCLEKLL